MSAAIRRGALILALAFILEITKFSNLAGRYLSLAQYPSPTERVRKDLTKVVGREREFEVNAWALEALNLL